MSSKTKPAVRWPGGKSRHLKSILPRIPEHRTYVEVFAGGLAVLLAKPRSPAEVINDLNHDLIAFYRNVRLHPEALSRELDFQLNARADFEDYRQQIGLTELQRVVRWFCRNIMSWGAKGCTFGMTGAKASFEAKQDAIRAVYRRLARVTIESRDYKDILRLYDKPGAFFFMDPPYTDCDPGVYSGWTYEEMADFEACISKVKAPWLVTVDDSPATHRIFAAHKIEKIETRNNLASSAGRSNVRMFELLITPVVR